MEKIKKNSPGPSSSRRERATTSPTPLLQRLASTFPGMVAEYPKRGEAHQAAKEVPCKSLLQGKSLARERGGASKKIMLLLKKRCSQGR